MASPVATATSVVTGDLTHEQHEAAAEPPITVARLLSERRHPVTLPGAAPDLRSPQAGGTELPAVSVQRDTRDSGFPPSEMRAAQAYRGVEPRAAGDGPAHGVLAVSRTVAEPSSWSPSGGMSALLDTQAYRGFQSVGVRDMPASREAWSSGPVLQRPDVDVGAAVSEAPPPAASPDSLPAPAGAVIGGVAQATGGAAQAPGVAVEAEPDELVKRLYDPLLRRLKADLRLDRERRGALTDLTH